MMIRSFLTKIFGDRKLSKQPDVPKSFKQTNRSVFMNRYAGGVYFLIGWHLFGYFLISGAREKAANEGLSFEQAIVGDQKVKRIKIDRSFQVSLVDDDERPSI